MPICAASDGEGNSIYICMLLWEAAGPAFGFVSDTHSCREPCVSGPLYPFMCRAMPEAARRFQVEKVAAMMITVPTFVSCKCHPGPCPPCKAFAPPRRCPCGKNTITTRCSDRSCMLTCGQHCDKLLECGRHRCERICHTSSCGYCRVLINTPCFCKKKLEVVLCG